METVTLFITSEWIYDNPERWEDLKYEAIHTERDFLRSGFMVTLPDDYVQSMNFSEMRSETA